MPALALDQQHRREALAVGAVQALDSRDRLIEHVALDGAPLGVEFVEPDRERTDLVRIVARQQTRAKIGLADAAAGIDPRAQQESEMIGFRRFLQARDVGERRQPGIAALRHDLKAGADQRAVDAEQRDHVTDRAQGHEIEPLPKIGLRPRRAVPASLAQGAIDTHGEQERDANRGEMLVRAGIVDPVGIDHRHRLRQRDLRHMVVDHDEIESGAPRLGQRLEGGDAAIDRDDDGSAVLPDLQQRRRIGAVPLLATVRNVDADIAADGPEETQQQRRGGGAIDIVVAEHDDALARLDGPHEAPDGRVHVLQMRGIGQELAQRRFEKVGNRLEADVARRQQTANRIGQAMTLGDRQRQPFVAEPRGPALSRQRALDAEERCALVSGRVGHAATLTRSALVALRRAGRRSRAYAQLGRPVLTEKL